jgi:hypothetical protein
MERSRLGGAPGLGVELTSRFSLNDRKRSGGLPTLASFTVQLSTALRASAADVWDHASTMGGVNEELAPWLKMTVPAAARRTSLCDAPVGQEAFTSILLLGGILPFDVHHLTFTRIYRWGFDEDSWSWLQRRWSHKRRVEEAVRGCIVSDELTVTPRFAPALFVKPVVRWIFAARHRKLVSRFGAFTP